MRRMGLSCQRELYVCIVNNLGMSKFKFAEVPSSETQIYNLSEKTRTFKPDTKGSELVPELKIASENVFVKSKASARDI